MIWFTSDLHLGHALVSKLRGFDSIADHDATIIDNINSTVTPQDTLWVLGDMAMGGWADTIQQCQRIHSDIHVVLGNHDRPAPNMTNGHKHLLRFLTLGGFSSAQTIATVGSFLLSHYPYDGDHTDEDRFDHLRPVDTGRTLLHGHTHSSDVVSYSRRGTLQLHVGLDAHGLRPVSLTTIKDLKEEYAHRN